MRILALSSLAALILTGTAQAAPEANQPRGLFFKPYVGADYQYTSLDYGDDASFGFTNDDILEDQAHGGNIHVGARIHKFLGVEAGYSMSGDATKKNVQNTGIDTKVRLSGFNVDVLGYLPVSERLELIGTAGIARQTVKLSATGLPSESDDEIQGRIGGGAQYWVSKKLNVRGLVRYQNADFDGDVDGAVVANVGLNYHF